jgi:hypothetical protein
MFRIDVAEGGGKRVFDPESDTSVVLTGTTQGPHVRVFLMTHGEKRIPFEARVNHAADPVTGDEYRYYTFESFGRLSTDRPGTTSLAPGEEPCWKHKAAAALVVYGRFYNGLESPPERNRVLLDGRFYTRLDFGFGS